MWYLTLLSWNLARSLLAKTETLLLHPSMIPSSDYCELFQNSLTWIFYNLITFILPLSQRVWNVLQPSKSKFVHIYKIHLRWSKKSFLCAFVNQIKVKENKQITDSWFYFIFTKRSNFSGIGVVGVGVTLTFDDRSSAFSDPRVSWSSLLSFPHQSHKNDKRPRPFLQQEYGGYTLFSYVFCISQKTSNFLKRKLFWQQHHKVMQ